MGKASGVSRRRRKAKTRQYTSTNKLKRERKRELQKFKGITEGVVREAWEQKKSLKVNMTKMGLAADPNKLLRPATFHEQVAVGRRELLGDQAVDDIVAKTERKLKLKKAKYASRKLNKFDVEIIEKPKKKPATVATKLAEQAAKPRPKNFRLSPEDVKFCIYMLEKYDDDFEAMARDKLNYYQESPGQIRTKIKKFQSNPSQRKIYEKAKEIFFNENVAEDEDEIISD